jgi:hypothetical protein
MRQWDVEMNTIDDVDRLQEENVIILENMDNFAASSPTGNSSGATSSTKLNKKSSSKLGVKRKFEDLDSNESHNTLKDGLKSVIDFISNIA